MARILISPLGVGSAAQKVSKRDYEGAIYQFDGSLVEYQTPFIAAALSRHLEVDRIIMVGTGKSMWETVYQYFVEKTDAELLDVDYWTNLGEKVGEYAPGNSRINEIELVKVNEAIDMHLKSLRDDATGGSCCCLIDYGLNETELWGNFDIFMRIADTLDEGDEIYLDVTHSFRSIPIFMYLMLDFIKTLKFKNITLAGIYYGMLDARKDFGGRAPVVNLEPLFRISDWVKAVHDFTNYGNGYMIAELITEKKIADRIRNISELININYLTEMKREVDSLNHYLSKLNLEKTPVLKYVMPYLEGFTARFKGVTSNGEFQLELASWYFQNSRYANGYICLAESVVTGILEIYKKGNQKIDINREYDRKKGKKAIHNFSYKSNITGKTLLEVYEKISAIRNKIAHAGFNEIGKFEQDIKDANTYIREVRQLIFDNKELEVLPQKIPFNEL